ncbi:hypothetical protein BC940DRAFT_289451 [Gongronella butleri]|nr:hypothetical protein BC940DRAFT_289451 [Gongronella butleri]
MAKHVPRAAALIKPYLNKVVLQVHPDFFVHDASKKKHNAQALQQLYDVLHPILRPQQQETHKKQSDPITLRFFRKGNKGQQQQQQAPSVVFQAPGDVWPTVQDFFELCDHLAVPIQPSDRQAVRDTVAHLRQRLHRHPARSLQQQFADALYQEHHRHYQNANHNENTWTPTAILRQPLLMCHPDVDQDRVATQFAQWLPHLEPARWWGILPTLIVPEHDYHRASDNTSTKGILVLHDAMTEKDIRAYLGQHLQQKLRERSE